ncbi:MAG: cobalamin-dependent protein, partial [Ruminococcus flavefaciens]|nr:cobalamin-dependent protein [Ruminococcus flavefaciens]
MNVLLVMPKTGYLWDEWATPPIGIAYVSAYLKSNGVNVYTVNMNLENGNIFDVLRKNIEGHDIEIFATAELVVGLDKLQELVKVARNIRPRLKIWIGGGLVTNSPYEAMQLIPEADFGMIGEGEQTSLELVRFLENSQGNYEEEEICKIDGLIVRRGDGTLFCTKERKEIEDLDTIPFPDREGFHFVETCKKYAKESNSVTASIVSSRSCPFSCTFCSKTGGRK